MAKTYAHVVVGPTATIKWSHCINCGLVEPSNGCYARPCKGPSNLRPMEKPMNDNAPDAASEMVTARTLQDILDELNITSVHIRSRDVSKRYNELLVELDAYVDNLKADLETRTTERDAAEVALVDVLETWTFYNADVDQPACIHCGMLQYGTDTHYKECPMVEHDKSIESARARRAK